MKFAEYEAPCGRLLIGVHGQNICLCDWIIGDRIEKTLRRITGLLDPVPLHDNQDILQLVSDQLDKYFAGALRRFDIPIMALGTEFQRRVWEALFQIHYGKTVSYKEIATAIGLPHGVRAVASAIGANPLSLVIPCHRVVGSDGSLTGYAGGLEAKRFLLRLESDLSSIVTI